MQKFDNWLNTFNGDCFNQIVNKCLSNAKIIKFGCDFNKSLENAFLQNVTHLTLGWNFCEKICDMPKIQKIYVQHEKSAKYLKKYKIIKET